VPENNSNEILQKLERKGLLDTAIKALNKQVDGDPWKEKYIPIISMSIALISVIFAPIITWHVTTSKLEYEIKQDQRKSFIEFCIQWEEVKLIKPNKLEDYLKLKALHYKIRDKIGPKIRTGVMREMNLYALMRGYPATLTDQQRIQRIEKYKSENEPFGYFDDVCRAQ